MDNARPAVEQNRARKVIHNRAEISTETPHPESQPCFAPPPRKNPWIPQIAQHLLQLPTLLLVIPSTEREVVHDPPAVRSDSPILGITKPAFAPGRYGEAPAPRLE